MKIDEEMVACPWLTVYKAKIQIQDNPGFWGLYLVDPSPVFFILQIWCFLLKLSVSGTYDIKRDLVKIIDIQKWNFLLNEEIMSDYRSKFYKW